MANYQTRPDWFSDFVNQPRTSKVVRADGANIHYQTWDHGSTGTGLLFIHGHAAHSHWWDFIAPAFTDNYRPIAMDMSGAGDSDHRDQYSYTGFAREIMAVIENEKLDQVILIGHSFGGSMARVTGHLFGNQLQGIVLVDTSISPPGAPPGDVRRRPPPRKPSTRKQGRVRIYPSLAEGKRRFRLRPPQPCSNDYLLDYIAEHSLKPCNDGFVFKLDQKLFSKMSPNPDRELPSAAEMMKNMSCPIRFIYGEQSRFFGTGSVDYLHTLLTTDKTRIVKEAYHHVFLDQPQIFCATLSDLLTDIGV